jgi:hypothetical protein
LNEFRHKIGDELYDLEYHEGADGRIHEETVAYPIVRRTERYVYVNSRHAWERQKIIRFSVDDLERAGRAYSAANHFGVNVRPLPHWPLMPAIVRKPEHLAITP